VWGGGGRGGRRGSLERCAERWGWWGCEEDDGQTGAINKGLRRATGDILAYLNSDDLLMPKTLHRVARAFADPEVEAVCGWRVLIDQHGKPAGLYAYPQPTREVMLRRAILPQETVFWRKSVWDKVGEFNAEFRFTMDLDYWMRMTEHDIVPKLIPRFTGVFRVHEEQKSQAWEDIGRAEGTQVYARYHGDGVDTEAIRKQLPADWYRKLKRYRKLERLGLLRAPKVPWV